MKYYIVQAIKHKTIVNTTCGRGELKLSWADGMIGALPVFTNKRKAKAYADGVEVVECMDVKGVDK